tara:strand:+ start:368 stop:547 length:180 start_codon:yes stop_codon:yes gene_type:complete
MARTNRRREPDEVSNPNKGTKKNQRRTNRKNLKNSIKKIDYSRLDFEEEEDMMYTKGYD